MASPTIEELLEAQTFKILTPEQVSSFMTKGFLVLPGAIPQEKCDSWTENVWKRLDMDANDKSTWNTDKTNMPVLNAIPAKDIAPVAWAAICELLGGEDRIAKGGENWTDGFIVNHGTPETEGKPTPYKELELWHVDGDFFIHFLDSPEQALLVIPCWSDVEEDGGATVICTEGPKRIGQILYDHPEGLSPMLNHRDTKLDTYVYPNNFSNEVQKASDENFYQMTGKKGDVILMHPLMLHSASVNSKRSLRIITNPPVSLHEPFRFNRENPADYNLVEIKTMKELGGPEKFKDWKITGKREMFIPERARRQMKMQEQELERLRKLGIETPEVRPQVPSLMLAAQ